MKMRLSYSLFFVLICISFIHSQALKDSIIIQYSEKKSLVHLGNDVLDSVAQIVKHGDVSIDNVFNTIYRSKGLNKVLDGFITENNKMPDAILFFNGINGKSEWQLYDSTAQHISKLIYGQSIAIICVDNLPDVVYQVDINIEKLEPYLETEAKAIFSIALSLFSPVKKGAKGLNELDTNYFIKCDWANKITTPSNINVSIKQVSSSRLINGNIPNTGKMENIIAITDSKVYYYRKSDIIVKNVERRFIGFSIGVSYAQSNTALIAPDPALNDLNILKVSKGLGKQWKGNAIFMISLYPGIETDYTPNNNIWRIGDFICDFPKRFSLNFGFNINDRPFDFLYAGLGIRFNSISDLLLGINFNSSPKNGSSISLLKVSTLTDVSKLFPTKYESGMFFGLSIRILDAISLL
jgi:hypothetical protein